MSIKISKALESVMARSVFDVSRSGDVRYPKDRLMVELLGEESFMAFKILSLRLDEEAVAALRNELVQALDGAPPPEEGEVDVQAFYAEYAERLRERFDSARHISTAHALLDILADENTLSSGIFAGAGISAESLTADMQAFLEGGSLQPRIEPLRMEGAGSLSSEFLSRFGVDLTQSAREGRLDPVVGREREIERVVQILSRRKKNNPILVGEAGVGKSAIVEGVARLIAEGRAPEPIAGKRIFSLDVASLVAGTKFRGEFEERMQQLLQELRQARDTILFIDEIHTIVGAGSTQGSLDTANILKPALARGELQTIGATTLDEMRECIESDAALERRFQRVVVEPSTADETFEILKNVAPHYERHHAVRYADEVLRACVEMSVRYITDRHLPDKAIDLMDEVGAQVRLVRGGRPESLQRVEQLLAETRAERGRALEVSAYDRAAAARLHELALLARAEEERAEWRRSVAMNPTEVTVDDVARVVTATCGVPAERIGAGEAERLRGLEPYLHSRVIGQSEAVARVAAAVRRSRAGLKDAVRPAGVFMFVGATGVGKTLLAKELSAWLFGERQGLVRIDMSEYGERHSVARLIGSPPGYVGYGEGGQLSEAVRRRPYSLVLFDEIEKAHPEVFNALLQIFDEGRLTDGSGRTVDFRNTIIIMTSNAGSQAVSAQTPPLGFATLSKRTNAVAAPVDGYRKALERTFAPEFLNRVDDVVIFRPLAPADIERIVDLELASLAGRLAGLGYTLRSTSAARRTLAALGFESRYGARPLRRTIVERVEEPVANMIVEGRLRKGDCLTLERLRGGVAVRVKRCKDSMSA